MKKQLILGALSLCMIMGAIVSAPVTAFAQPVFMGTNADGEEIWLDDGQPTDEERAAEAAESARQIAQDAEERLNVQCGLNPDGSCPEGVWISGTDFDWSLVDTAPAPEVAAPVAPAATEAEAMVQPSAESTSSNLTEPTPKVTENKQDTKKQSVDTKTQEDSKKKVTKTEESKEAEAEKEVVETETETVKETKTLSYDKPNKIDASDEKEAVEILEAEGNTNVSVVAKIGNFFSGIFKNVSGAWKTFIGSFKK